MTDLELIDCGDGRRLERFGRHVVDRSAPPATDAMRDPQAWARADLRWAKGGWAKGATTPPWTVRVGPLVLECRPAAGGQVGVFPEHAATWAWLDHEVRRSSDHAGQQLEVLSLFGYTGGASLACAAAGARVVHVDASKPAVAWARRNAELSGLADMPVRWIVDDARAFVRRERRRGRHYDGVVLDPPSYGHGTGAWEIERDLEPLLEDVAALLGPKPAFAVLSAHTQGYDGELLAALVRSHLSVAADGEALTLRARSGATLPLGAWAHGPNPPGRVRRKPYEPPGARR
jgi:23S rRNA (cytosine1962-C5)-methyltransferase